MAVWKKEYQAFLDDVTEKSKKENDGAAKAAPSAISLEEVIERYGAPMPQQQQQMMQQSDATKRANANVIRNQAQAMMGTDMLNIDDQQLMEMYKQADTLNSGMNSQLAMAGSDPRVAQYSPQLRQAQMTLEKAQRTMGRDRGGVSEGWKNTGKSAAQLREEAYQERLKGINTPEDYAQLMSDLDDTERKANLFQRGSTVRMQANKEFAAMLPYMTDEQLQQVYDAAYSNLSTGSKMRDTILGIWPGAKTTIYNKSAGPLDIFGTDDPETQFLKDVRKEQERRKVAYGTNLEENAQALWDRMTPEQQADYNYYYRPYAGADDVMDKGRWAAEQIKAQQMAELNAVEGGLWDSLPQEAKMAAAGEWGSRMHIPDAKEQEDWARKYMQDKIGADVDAMLTESKEWVDPLGAEDRAIVDQRVNEYLNFSAKGYMGKTASEIYAAQAEEKAEGWHQASMGQYTGDDQDIKAANDAFVAAESRLDELNDMLIDMDPAEDSELYAATEAQIAQLANELNGMHENINALANGETTDLNEIKHYLYGDASIWRLIGTSAMQGATNFAQGTYQTANMLLGQPMNAIGQAITGKQYTSGLTKWTQDYQQYAQEWSQEAENAVQALGGGAVYRAINNTISNMVENIPNTLMSIMSGRMMSAGELATAQNQTISALNAMGMERTAAQTVMQSMIRDPQYWLSFMREAGSDYQEAIDDGADMTTASVYAFVTAFINSGIEIGVEGDSGFEGIGKGKDGGFMGKVLTAVTGKDMDMLASILESMGEEGGEEFKQSLVSGLLKKAMYNEDMQYISFDENTDAVFNLPKTGREMLYGALAGGMMAGTMEPATSYISNIAADTQTGSQIIGNDQAQALAGIAEDSAHIHNKTTAGIKNGTIDLNTKAGQRAVGKLFRETYMALDEASQTALDGMISQPVQRQLEANGYEGDAAEAAQIIAKEYHGGRLTKPERAIMDDPMVSDIAAKLWEGEFGDEGIKIDDSDVKRQNYQQATAEDLNTLAEMPKLNRQDTHSTDQEGVRTDLQQPDTSKFGAVNARNEAPEATADQATGMVPDDQNGTETARLFGETGRSAEDLESTLTNNDIEFNNEEVKKAYEEGRQQRRQKAAAELEHIRELNRGGKDGNRQGVVRSISAEEASKYNVKRMTQKLSKKQYAAVQALRKVAGRMNLNIVLYESQMNDDGKRTGAQGFYDSASDTVYLDMFAGYGNEQAILRTAAHELTHVIQKWSPEKYSQLQEYLNEVYYKNGKTTLNELLQAQMEKAANAGHDLDEKGAMDEVTADAMEMMLSDTDAIRNLAQKDEGLFTKIKNWINDFVTSIRTAMEGIDPHSREAKILADMRDEWEKLQGMWLDAMNSAAENRGGDFVEAELQDMKMDTEGTVVKRKTVGDADEILAQGQNNDEIKLSDRDTITTNGIKPGMNDTDRYKATRGTNVRIQDATGLVSEDVLSKIDKANYNEAEKIIAPIAKQYNLISDGAREGIQLDNHNLTVKAGFSRRSLHESVQKQGENLRAIAALMPVFKETYESAVPVLAQKDRYQYTVNDRQSIDAFVYLLGGFNYNGNMVPVQFELKHINSKESGVYIVATIKEDVLLGTSEAKGSHVSPTSSYNASIEDVIKKVNPENTRILANLPEQFLTKEQLAGKRKGLENKGAYIRDKAREAGRNINAPVTMTTSRIDADINRYGAKFSPDYSKAYMTFIDPADFVKLNADSFEQIENSSRALVASELREDEQTPYFRYDQETNEVIPIRHEGRHRMVALANAGVKQAAVLVLPEGTTGRNSRQTIGNLTVHDVDGNEVTLYNLIPVNEAHRQELIDTYGEGRENWIQYSDRETTERELSKEAKNMKFGGHTDMLQFSIRSAAEATGLDLVVDDNAVQKYVLYNNGEYVKPGSFTADMVKNTPVGKMIEIGQRFAADKRNAEKNAHAQRKFIADIINMISLYQDAAMVWELAGSMTFSALKTNGDPQYSDSYDFGSICAKTQNILNNISATQLRLGRGLTKAEIDGAVYEEVGRGVQDAEGNWHHGATPCPVCYVYATWVNKPARLEMVRQFIQQYQNWTDAQIDTFMNAEAPTGRNETESRRLKTEMNQRKLWMKLCLAEQKKDSSGNKHWVRRANPEFCPNEILLDLRRSADMATKYPGTWNFMQRGGNALGKAIAPYSDSRVGETIVGKATGADSIGKKLLNDEIRRLESERTGAEYKPKFINPFLTVNAKQAEKMFRKAMANIKKQNLKGGQRWQSWSDFRAEWGSDYLMEMLTMQLLGSQVQTYTKVVEAVDLLASAGFEVNLSGMPYGDGFWHNEDGNVRVDKDGNAMLRFSPVTGINPEAAMEFVRKYGSRGNVQFMTVGISDEHVRAALKSNDITFVIPFHGSGGSVRRVQNLMSLLHEKMNTGDDYTNAQSDSFAEYTVVGEGKSAKKVNSNPNWVLREAILTGNYDRLNKAQKNAIRSNEYLNRLYHERYVDDTAEAYGVFFSKSEAQQIYPYEYWDKYTTLATADVNSLRFVEYCQMLGVVPRFSGLTKKDDNGNEIEYANFSGARRDATGKIIGYDPVPGYWKLLIDRSMYNRAYDDKGNLIPDQCTYHQPRTVSVNDINVGMMPQSANNTVGYSDDDVRQISERIVQRIQMESAQNKAAGDALNDTHEYEDNEQQRTDPGDGVRYSLRTDPAPKKVVYGYKAFYARDGKLYPPMVSNIADEEQKVTKATSGTMKGLPTPIGVWLDADVGGIQVDENGTPVRTNTTGRLRVKNAKSGGDASLAFRPGWHLGEWPDAKQFNKMDPTTGERTLMPDDLVFALCEISADNDYQLDALSYGINEKGGFSRSQAGLPWIPKDGYYKYRTNVDPTTAPWLIAGSIRVVDILDDDDCARICAQFGVKPDKRYSGKKINLADYGLKRGTVTADAEGMERFAKNDASRANDTLLENALNDPAYANAYVQRPIDFDNPKQYKQLENEFRMNGQDIEEYRRLYDQRGYLGRGETQYSDRDYNEAVRNNDEDTLQQMVQDAAEAAMPDSTVRDEDGNLMPVYHGTDADFTEFDMSKGRANMDIQGAFFSPWELDASGYGQKVGTYYLDIKNPASEGEAFAALNRFKGQNNAGTKAREYLISQGYDGVNGEGMEYIAFYPEQIKSADPVTYDDNGNIIPLSERFNKTMSDFRFSDRDQNYKTDREILAEALESVAANDEEKKMLADYKALASTLDNNEKLVRSLNEQIRNARLEEPNGETEKRLVAERNSVQKAIDAADKKLYNLERMAPMRRIAKEERRKAENDLERAREHMQRYREGIMRREYIGRIERTSRRLAKWLTAPAGKSNNYVPEVLRRPLGNFLMTIDKISAQRKAGGPMTEEDKKFANQLQQIEQMLRNIEHSRSDDIGEEIEDMYSAYIDLPKGFTDTMAQLVSKVQERIESAGTKNLLDEMVLNELEALDMTLTAISSSITHINDFLSDAFAGTVSETAEKTIEEMRQIRQKMSGIRGLQRAADFVIWDNVMPVYAFERLGEGGQRVFRALRDGQDKLAFNAQRIIDIAEGLYTSEEAKEWSKEIVEFTNLVSGETIRMTVAHLMSLYALSRREQALGHLLGEGFRVADFKEKRNTVTDKGHVINEVTLREMFKKLTERQKQVAESMVNTMSTTGSEWGNYVSMRRFGYRQFTEKNYFPIKSDSDLLPAKTDTSTGNELYKLLNMSMTKPLTVKANNRIMVESIFDVFAGHMADMALYNAMALPVLDAVKWLNYKTSEQEEGETAKYTDGVRDAIRDAYGTAAIRYVTELLKDVNGGGQVNDTGVDLTQKMLGKYNRVAVAANLRVAMLQPLAIIRAANELPGTSLAKGTLKAIPNLKHEIAEMQEKSGIALWKSLGYRETNIGRSVKQQIKHMETLTDKISDKSMFLAELGDSVTWGAMWKTSKEYIRKTRADLRPDTDEYWNAVVEKFENVIYNTQVVDSILTKSQLMRSSKTTNRMMSSFMSEPTTTFNTLMRAWDRMRVDMLKGKTFAEAWQKHGLSMGRTALVFLISAVVETVISQLMSAYRDDDDYETFKEKIEDGWFETLADNANPLTLLPGIKQLYEAGIKPLLGMETFDDQNVLTEGISTTVQGIQKIVEGKGTVWGRAYTLAKGISMSNGLPIHPVMREFQALWNNTVVRIRPDWRLETSKTPQATGYDSMYAAYMEGDTERVQSLTERLNANGYDEEKIESAMNTRIQKDLKAGEITQEEAEKALQEMGGLDKDKAYYKVQQIMDEDGSYSRFDNLEQAIRTGTGYQDAATELTSHGYEMSDVTGKAKSIVAEMAIADKLTETQIQKMLTQYAGMTADEAYIRSQELKYQQLTGEKTTSDAAMVFYAIDNKTSPKAAIDALKQHGKKPSSIASSITSRYKDQYLDLMAKGKTSEAAALKGRLITVFDYLGYNGSDKIAGWEKTKTN